MPHNEFSISISRKYWTWRNFSIIYIFKHERTGSLEQRLSSISTRVSSVTGNHGRHHEINKLQTRFGT